MILNRNQSYHITVDGKVSAVMPKNKKDFKLEEAQKLVEGFIEVVQLTKNLIMIVNEEGKYTKKMNPMATFLAQQSGALYEDDYICGNVVICPSKMLR
jgi:hypothetical protein